MSGVLLCLTVIGIPFGLVSFRLAVLALAPLGKQVVRRNAVPGGASSWPRLDGRGCFDHPDVRLCHCSFATGPASSPRPHARSGHAAAQV